ncbi:hypothetical protein F5883DRAFT_591972 [Diaporthe sp. PMI_573]|nr:hypothetical protein F5883DRAFT_591972 [Diaporthaceae sp. PMI_573]
MISLLRDGSTGCLSLMVITTIPFLRIPLIPGGPKVHVLLAVACLCGLLWHVVIPDVRTYSSGTAIVAACIWFVSFIHKIIAVLFTTSSIIQSKSDNNQVTRLMVDPDRPLHIMPGDYFIIFLPGTFLRYNLRRTYPAIAVPKLNNLKEDEKPEEDEKPDKLMLFVAQDYAQDFPVKIYDRILLRGPYTQDLDLQRHETVVLIARGLGIVDLLPLALTLAERRVHDMRAKGSKDSIKETEGSGLFRDLTRKLKRLRSLDSNNNLLNVHAIFPMSINGPEDLFEPGDQYWKWQNSMPDTGGNYKSIKGWAQIHTLSPGQSIMVVSGDKSFLRAMRRLATDLMGKDRIIRFKIPQMRLVEMDGSTEFEKNQNQSTDLENGIGSTHS